MAESLELRASLNSLKRVDPYVKEILATATQVALYKFNVGQNVWEKDDKEGALFLYRRNGEPYHSILIFNRLNKDNFIEPIIKDFEYQVQLPFLLYRSKTKIFGIWFFNTEECTRVASIIESLMDNHQGDDQYFGHDKPQNGQGNVDIFSLLSKAQDDFNKTPSKGDSQPTTFSASTPRIPDIASQSVMDFFAKAGSKTATQQPAPSNENVLQRLMSNPAHSVEHIEKQQRSVTPQELGVSFRGETAGGGSDRRMAMIGPSSSSCPVKKFESFEHSNGFNIPQRASPCKRMSGSPLGFLMRNQAQGSEDSMEINNMGTSPFQQFLENAQKPLLMTPMMFTTPNASKDSPPHVTIKQRSPPIEDGEPVEMLTEKQLAQALIYLLKNNSDFIKQIHRAYTDSILDKVDKPNRERTTN